MILFFSHFFSKNVIMCVGFLILSATKIMAKRPISFFVMVSDGCVEWTVREEA